MRRSRFMRMLAEKCLRSAQFADDPKTVAELRTMVRNLTIWADEEENVAPGHLAPSRGISG
jgi:hypothetical protein